MSPLTSVRRVLAATAVTAALVVTGACSDADDSPAPGGGPDKVTYLTGFQASAHDAFIFFAEERGYFDEAGIDLTIELGAGNQNLPLLLAGQADFTYIDLTGLLMNIGSGDVQPGDFQALAAIHHTTLAAFVVPVDVGVEVPADLEGKRIGAFLGSPTYELVPAYAEMAGWDFDPDLLVGTSPQDLFTTLATGQVDLLSTFIIQQGVVEATVGTETVAFPFNEYLDDVLGTGLLTTTALAEENPDLAIRFRDAALRGLKDTLADPEGAIAALQAAHPDAVTVVEPLVNQIRVMDPYITGQGQDRIGVLDEAHIVRCISVLVSSGVIETEVEPDAILGDVTLLAT